MSNEFIRSTSVRPGVPGTLIESSVYNANVAGTCRNEGLIGIDQDGQFQDFAIGSLTAKVNGALCNGIKLRAGAPITFHNASGVITSTVNLGQATETILGQAEIATQSETNVGLDDFRFITPVKLADSVPNSGRLVDVMVITSSGSYISNTGSGGKPRYTGIDVYCSGAGGGGGATGAGGNGGNSSVTITSEGPPSLFLLAGGGGGGLAASTTTQAGGSGGSLSGSFGDPRSHVGAPGMGTAVLVGGLGAGGVIHPGRFAQAQTSPYAGRGGLARVDGSNSVGTNGGSGALALRYRTSLPTINTGNNITFSITIGTGGTAGTGGGATAGENGIVIIYVYS